VFVRNSVLSKYTAVFWVLAVVLFVGAIYRLSVESYVAMFAPLEGIVAHDLMARRTEATTWFAGGQVYGAIESADYPPASYALLYLATGWSLTQTAVRVVWTLTALLGIWSTALILRGASGGSPAAGVFLTAVVCAAYPMAATLRIGQSGIHSIAAVVGAVALLARTGRKPTPIWIATALMLVALVKPTFSAPFVWLLLAFGGMLPLISLVAGYVVLTLFAAHFQQSALMSLLRGWLDQRDLVDLVHAHGNLHSWLAIVGKSDWILPGSLLMLCGAGVWTLAAAKADPWLVFGVLSVIARTWSYHRWYDDMLLLGPLVSLCRLAAQEPKNSWKGETAVGLLLVLSATLVAPASWLQFPPFGIPLEALKTGVSWAVLVFLVPAIRLDWPQPFATPMAARLKGQ
jgi:hypothetical protein